MSRSYKKAVDKYPGFPGAKKFANRAVRRYKGEIPDGGWYKKLYCQWEVIDIIEDGRFDPETKWMKYYGTYPSWQTEKPGAHKRKNGWHFSK